MTKRVGLLVGSLRKASWNRKLAQEIITLSPVSLEMHIVEINDLPLYNQDLDDNANPSPAWSHFRSTIKSLDGVLFFTPEYNRSFSAVIKNAIDVGSRPYGQSVWQGKPTAVLSASIGAIGGFAANHHLRQTFVCLDMPCMQQPEAYIGNIHQHFDETSQTFKEDIRKFLRQYIEAYAQWISKYTG